MFSIGEFSKMTGLTVKTLRYYQEMGILVPSYVETGSGYRFYAESKIETARVISVLRDLEFSLADIKQMLSSYDDDADIVAFLQARKDDLRKRIRKDQQLVSQLDKIITQENEVSKAMSEKSFEVEIKNVEPQLIASFKMQGHYSDCGDGFSRIGRKFGRHICGKAMMLHHDLEYRDGDANFEVAMPIKKGTSTDEIEVKELDGGRCISLMHLGPYSELNWAYEKVCKYAKENELAYDVPTREIYHKGPGMIFRGNPKKYLTEIQLMLN